MIDELNDAPPPPTGVPAYMVTFADLMSLLLCFFVLLLSFAQVDLDKFKLIAASMQNAMGIQQVVIIPDAKVVVTEVPQSEPEKPKIIEAEPAVEPSEILDAEAVKAAANAIQQQETEALATEMAKALIDEIRDEKVELVAQGRQIIIRLRESGSFEVGSDVVQPAFVPTMAKIRQLLSDTPGRISISGHTDNAPIHTERFRSNWDLSSARAVSVAHELMLGGAVAAKRISVSGHADTQPLDETDNDAARARNRRVEIIVER